MTITHSTTSTKGLFLATENDQKMGEMVYSMNGPDRLIIEHTEGFPGSEGKGVGAQLLAAAVDHARTHGLRIVPVCPFARKMMDRRKEEYTDVRA